jgi:trigger factor
MGVHLQDLKVAFKEENLKEEIDKLAQEMRKEISVPGFRKGRAPINIIKARFNDQLRAESIQRLIQDKMTDIIGEYEPFVYGPPIVKKLDQAEGEITLEVSLDVPPKVDLDLSTIKIDDDNDKEIDISEELEKLREINSELKSVKRKIKKGDVVFINIQSGEEVISNYSWEVGNDGFSKNLLGLKTDEEKQIEIELPENFPIKGLTGKKTPLKMFIVEVKEKIKPNLDDEFAKDLGFNSLRELKKDLRKNIEEEIKKNEEDNLKNKVVKKALDLVGNFPASPTLVKLSNARGLNEKEAESIARQTALLDAIALKEKMIVDEHELDEWLEKIAESNKEEFEDIEEFGEEAIRFVKQSILREKTINLLVDRAKKEGA